MSDAPERIWACVSKNTKSGVVTLLGDATFPVDGWQEYVRADRIEELTAKLAKAVEALTPSGDTKAEYMGEFHFSQTMIGEDGDEVTVKTYVPWTTIKKIMAAINARANLAEIKGESHD